MVCAHMLTVELTQRHTNINYGVLTLSLFELCVQPEAVLIEDNEITICFLKKKLVRISFPSVLHGSETTLS